MGGGVPWDGKDESQSDDEQKSPEEKAKEQAVEEAVIPTKETKDTGGTVRLDEPRRDEIKEGVDRFGIDENPEDGRKREPEPELDGAEDASTETLQKRYFQQESDGQQDGDSAGSPLDDSTSWSGETKRAYEEPETNLELLKMIDDFVDAIDEDLQTAKERKRAGEYYKVTDRLGRETTTQSKLSFDYVRDDGIIVDGDEYIGLQKVKPTRWQSKDKEEKTNILRAYVAFLKSLQWGIAIPCYPKAFDFMEYIGAIHHAGTEAEATGAHPILDYGRRYHIVWTSNEIDPSKIKKKEFYVVCRVNSKMMNRTLSGRGDSSLLSMAVGEVMRLWRSEPDEAVEEACIDEIRQRQQTMKSELARTGVEVTNITERQTAMELLYHYYNHAEPVLDEFDRGTFTEADFSEVIPE